MKRQLRAHLHRQDAPSPTLTPSPAAGTQLVREWNWRIYRVNVQSDGFEMDGQAYTSLTAIAKRITGAKWSGPRFFGLTKASA